MSTIPSGYLTVPQAAATLRARGGEWTELSERTVKAWCQRGIIANVLRLGGSAKKATLLLIPAMSLPKIVRPPMGTPVRRAPGETT